MENSGEFVHVPEDITSEILRRLPVESLLRLRCVCKSWRDLILSAQFIQSHTNDINSRTRAIFFKNKRLQDLREKFFGFNEEDEVDKLMRKFPEFMHLIEDYQIHGHCNGIICLSLGVSYLHEVPRILLWNPALRQCRALPPASLVITHDYLYRLGFGYDSANRDYKVVNVPKKGGVSEMYSLKSNSWKPIHCDHLRFLEYKVLFISLRGCSFKGRLHWIVCCRPRGASKMMFLVVFDLTGEKFMEFYIPESVPKNHRKKYPLDLGVFKGRLSWLVQNSSREYEIWSLEDDSCTPESWTRAWKFSREALQLDNRLRIQFFQLTEDENVLIDADYDQCDSFFFLYDVQMNGLKVRKTVEDTEFRFRWLPITNYVETLVSIMQKPPRRRRRNLPATRTPRKRRKSSLYAMP